MKKVFKFLLVVLFVCITSVHAADAVTKLVCVGDSITAGVGIKGMAGKYTTQLGQLLGDTYKVYRFGKSGATMLKKGTIPYWNEKLFGAVLKNKPQVIIIFLGTNDAQIQNWKHGEDFVGDYKAMIKVFSEIESKPKIYLCIPVPVFKKGGPISADILTKEIIPKIKQIAKETGCPVIDLYTPLKGKSDFFKDGVHPNEKGAKIIAETMFKSLTSGK